MCLHVSSSKASRPTLPVVLVGNAVDAHLIVHVLLPQKAMAAAAAVEEVSPRSFSSLDEALLQRMAAARLSPQLLSLLMADAERVRFNPPRNPFTTVLPHPDLSHNTIDGWQATLLEGGARQQSSAPQILLCIAGQA